MSMSMGGRGSFNFLPFEGGTHLSQGAHKKIAKYVLVNISFSRLKLND